MSEAPGRSQQACTEASSVEMFQCDIGLSH
jgi:hypothetical protein